MATHIVSLNKDIFNPTILHINLGDTVKWIVESIQDEQYSIVNGNGSRDPRLASLFDFGPKQLAKVNDEVLFVFTMDKLEPYSMIRPNTNGEILVPYHCPGIGDMDGAIYIKVVNEQVTTEIA